MPEASNATESRLSKFIEGCSQLQEIYAVAPLTYTNIMGEWWQRINDIIYTLGLTETEGTVVNIAWTVPEVGRKRSPFFVEELTTKNPDGEDVSEESRVSTVAGDGTGQLKAHKYGLIQSVDALFQRNINTWGGLYDYFFNQQHASEQGAKPADITEMLFGDRSISTESNDEITNLFNDATRNLYGNDKGLVNSLKHAIEDVIGSLLYDWLDNLSSVEETRPNGLQELLFGPVGTASDSEYMAKMEQFFERLTTSGITTEVVKLIDALGLDFYEWLARDNSNDPNNLQEYLFGSSTNYQETWNEFTTNGLATETAKIVATIGKGPNGLYEWLNDPNKRCTIASKNRFHELWQYNGSTWTHSDATHYSYQGKCIASYEVPIPARNDSKYIYPKTLDSTKVVIFGTATESSISTVYGNGATTVENVLKREFLNYITSSNSPLNLNYPSPSQNDVVFISLRMIVNSGLGSENEYECVKTGLFVWNGSTWSLVNDTYDRIIPGAYASKEQAVAQGSTTSQACLIQNVTENEDLEDSSPKTLMELIFGPQKNGETLCDIWKTVSSGSLIKETEMLKDIIGPDMIEWLTGENGPICIDKENSKPGPYTLKELIFGSMSTDEICSSLKKLADGSLFGEITNITNFLGDAYLNYLTVNNYNSHGPETVSDPSINPLTVLYEMDNGEVLYGNTNEQGQRTFKSDYIVDSGYICDTFAETISVKGAMTDQERMFNTYHRVAYTTTGYPLPSRTSATDGTIDNYGPLVSDSTIYYYSGNFPFITYSAMQNVLSSTTWPTTTISTGTKTGSGASEALTYNNFYIYNCCSNYAYALMVDTAGTETCADINNGTTMSTASIISSRPSQAVNLSYKTDTLVKTWTVNVDGGKKYVYAFAIGERVLNKAFTTSYGGIMRKKNGAWTACNSGTSFAAGETIYSGIAFIVNRNIVTNAAANPILENTDTNYVYKSGTYYKCPSSKYDIFEYYWNVAVNPCWYNDDAYGENNYRNHFVYVKQSLFHPTPSLVTSLGIQSQPFSNGDPVDSLSWIYDKSKSLVFLGCNSVKWTGFLSNKKFDRFKFETTVNSNTDDDDGTGIIVGGYKDDQTGIINTLSLVRSYSGNTSIAFGLNYGGPNAAIGGKLGKNGTNQSITLFSFNSVNSSGLYQDFKLRHLNGKYGYYNGNTFVKRSYDSTNNYIHCDPDIASNGTQEAGYYAPYYGIHSGSTGNFSVHNVTKTIYKDIYVSTGPNNIKNPVSITLTNDNGTKSTYTYAAYTTTKNGRRMISKDGTTSVVEASNNWNDDPKVIQCILDIVKHGGLIFARTHCTADTTNSNANITVPPLSIQHVLPYHTSGTSFSTWWGRISDDTKTGIRNSIRYIFRKTANATITSNLDLTASNNSDVDAVLEKIIYPKYQLSTLTYSKLTLDDLFKLYHGGTRFYAGDAKGNCYKTVVALGWTQGYGYLNAYSKYNLNGTYSINREPDFLEVTYKDIFYRLDGVSAENDRGIQYIQDKQPYAGDIIVTLKYSTIAGENNTVNDYVTMDVVQKKGNTIVAEVHRNSNEFPELGDARIIKMLHEPTGYGYIGCSNPLTNFTNNTFLDYNNSTIYDLETNRMWVIGENTNEYVKIMSDSTAEIYKKYGPGRIIANDITGKVYYTRGDANTVQKIVEGTTSIVQQTQSTIGYDYYDSLKTDILNAVKEELYGPSSSINDNNEDVDDDAIEITEEVASDISTKLADGNTIISSNGKLTVNLENAQPEQLSEISQYLAKSNGGLSVDSSTGKLVVDFSYIPSSSMQAIVRNMIQPGGGLAVDSNGQIYVDFDSMPIDRFTKLMSDMIDAQTLTTTDGLNQFYVDGSNGSDSDPESRGAPNAPFKSIQGCVNYITKVYKFATTNAYINCKNINSTEKLVLPSFDRTTARITIRAANFNESTSRAYPSTVSDYSIKINYTPTGGDRYAVDVNGTGIWTLYNFDVQITDAGLTSGGGHVAALFVGDYATAKVGYCKFTLVRDTECPWKFNYTTGEHVIYTTSYGHIDVSAGLKIYCTDLSASKTITSTENAGTYNRAVDGIHCIGSSSIQIDDTRDLTANDGEDKRIVFNGSFQKLIYCTSRISRNRVYNGTTNTDAVLNADYRFHIAYGGNVAMYESGRIDATHNNADATDTWLGTTTINADGTNRISSVQTETYSWYD